MHVKRKLHLKMNIVFKKGKKAGRTDNINRRAKSYLSSIEKRKIYIFNLNFSQHLRIFISEECGVFSNAKFLLEQFFFI